MTSSAALDFDSLSPLGWDRALEEAFIRLGTGVGRPARVSRADRRRCTVLGPDPSRADSLRQLIATGDWVVVAPGPLPGDEEMVTAVLPRRTTFLRERSGAETAAQVIAANVDRVFLLCGLDVQLNAARLERYLALAWQSGAVPVVVLTKGDTRSGTEVAAAIQWARGVALGVDVQAVSATTGEGLPELAASHLALGRTVAVLGPSGVGKSSLINALAGRELMPTGATRRDGKGRHTTTHGQLLVLPERGVLLDTPGMRGLGLWDAAEGLAQTFGDLEDLAARCRFSNCRHGAEPGCAVTAAISKGALQAARVESWRKLQRELKSLAARQGDQLLRQEAQRRWKAISREARRNPR
ncbi:MAG TPA: ribosome small subunit-dependent GTPase A [Candidatus Dormibacteraeota bacterium]|nr:ribosome small subunit-dependent GTPase A [Candidatus Dormibacteraeota bacterium]